MTPSDVRPYTVATIGHPANERVIVKTAQGYWRDVETGQHVDPEDFRAGWSPLVEVAQRCHAGCAEFVGGEHAPEINPTDGAWRLECSDCGTVLCIRPTREEVVTLAREHAIKPLPPYREGSYFQQNTGEACWSCSGLTNCAPGPRCIYQDSHHVTPDASRRRITRQA